MLGGTLHFVRRGNLMRSGDLPLHILALIGAIAIGATLHAWGQPLISTSGTIRFWVGSVFSGENSQQIADWYTLSHIVHGILVAVFGSVVLKGRARGLVYLLAIGTGVAWEIVEHTDLVLDQFREATLYQGYRGDSVLNAVADYVWMLGGFYLARAVGTPASLAMIVVLELTAAFVARDCLVLTTLMLVHPVDAIESWQQELNPNARPAD